MECDVVDEWGPWLRPLRPQNATDPQADAKWFVVCPQIATAMWNTREEAEVFAAMETLSDARVYGPLVEHISTSYEIVDEFKAKERQPAVLGLTRDQARTLFDVYSDEMGSDDPAAQDAFSALTSIANTPMIEHQSMTKKSPAPWDDSSERRVHADVGASRHAPTDTECKSMTGGRWRFARWDDGHTDDWAVVEIRDGEPYYGSEKIGFEILEWGRWVKDTECRSVSLTEEQIRRVAEHAAAIWPTQTVYGAVVDALRAMDCGSNTDGGEG